MENDQESNQNTTQLFNVIVKHGQFSRNNVLEYAKSKLSPKEKIVRIKDWIEIQSGIPSDQYEDVEECDADIVDSNDEFKSKKRKYDIFDDDFESVIVQTRRKKDPFKNGIVYISCEWIGCRYGSNDYTEFQKHVKSHMHELLIKSYSSGDNVYVCLWDLCNFETPDSEEIKRHVNYHTYHTRIKTIGKSHLQTLPDCYKDSSLRNKIPKLQEDWICRWTGCTMKFFCIQEYFDHVKCHALGEKAVGKLLSCRWLGCCKTSVNIWYLFRHTRLHTLEKEYACHNCGNAFTNKQKLTDHCDRQVKRMEYKCGECSNIYGSLRLLRTHSVNHSRIHKCGQCDMAFSRPSILVNHIRHVHIDCKPFKCHLCSYGCVNKSDLKDHIYRHDKRGRKWIGGMEGRIYACHICERGYSRACALTKHLAKIHAYKVPGKFTRLKYDLSDDGVYRLSHNLYGETSVSTNEGNEDIKQRREIKQKCKKAKKSKSGDEISEKNTGDFTVVQCEKPSCNNVASFVVLRADQEEDSLKTILAMQGRPVDNDVQTNKDIIVKTPKISKKKLLNSRKRKKAVFKTKDIIKTKISKIETTTLPDNDKKPKNIKVKEEPKEYCEIPIVQVKKELEENHIEISIEDVDFQGNIVKREVVESHQFILT